MTVTIPRRTFFAVAAAALLVAGGSAMAQRADGPEQVDVNELMKPGDLPDLVFGNADAPVTVVEYASMTCGHCGNFHNKVFPALKAKYIDTGKVRFVYRDFPFDNLAAAGAMLSRCVDADKSAPLISVLYEKQESWAFVRTNPVPELFKIARQAGFTQESFDKCLTDQKLLDQILAVKDRGAKLFGVNSTPTFFVNGKRLRGAATVENFDAAIAAAGQS